MQNKRTTFLILFVLVALLLSAAYYTYQIKKEKKYAESDFAQMAEADGASFTYKTLDGQTVDMHSYRGSYLVVNTWATWTPFSVDELKMIHTVASEYSDKIVFLAINRKEASPLVASFVGKLGINDVPLVLLDEFDTFFKSIDGFAMPETIMYDQSGAIVYRSRGPMKEEVFRAALDTMLATSNED